MPPGALPVSGFAVFGRGTDNRLWWRYQTSSGWSGWAPLGGVLTSKSAVSIGAAVAPGALSVFVRGSDGAVWGRALHGTPIPGQVEWSPWVSPGGKLLPGTAPASAGNAPGLFVATVGTDHAVWVREQLAAGWHSMHGKLTSGVTAITRTATSQTSVFVLGTDDLPWGNGWPDNSSGEV